MKNKLAKAGVTAALLLGLAFWLRPEPVIGLLLESPPPAGPVGLDEILLSAYNASLGALTVYASPAGPGASTPHSASQVAAAVYNAALGALNVNLMLNAAYANQSLLVQPSGLVGYSFKVGNPSGMVFHYDNLQYASLDALMAAQPAGSAFTVIDDCPGGAETLNNDPFHDSSGSVKHVYLITSAACLYTVNAPIQLKLSDVWIGAIGGYSSNQVAAPVAGGTIAAMGPNFPAAIPSSSYPAAPTASWGGTDGVTCPNSSPCWTTSDFYFVGVTGETASGETPLLHGTYASNSYTSVGSPASTNHLNVTVPGVAAPFTGYCVYVVQSTISNPFVAGSYVAPSFQRCYSPGSQTIEHILGYSIGNNPPPNANLSQTLITLGPPQNGGGQILTGTFVQGITADCRGGLVGFANTGAQDPPSGLFQVYTENCTGDAGLVEEGYDGHLGANGSSARDVFAVVSNCGSITGGCTGGINTLNSGTVSVTQNSTAVTWSTGATFNTSGTVAPWAGAAISINGATTGCTGGSCTVQSVTDNHDLVLATAWTGVTGTYSYGVAYTASAWPKYAIWDDAVPNLKGILGVDIGADNCGDASDNNTCPLAAGIELTGPTAGNQVRTTLENIHLEGLATGCPSGGCVPYAVDDAGMTAIIAGVHTSAQATKSVHIAAGTVGTTVLNVTPSPGKGALQDDVNGYTSPNGQFVGFHAVGNAQGQYLDPDVSKPTQTIYVPNAGDLTNSSNDDATFTTLGTFNVIAGASYDLSCQIVYQAASTGGLEMALGGTATATFAQESIRSGTSASAQLNQAHNAATIGNTTPTLNGGAVTTATTDFPSEFKAGLEISGAGTLIVEFQSAASAVQTKVRRGSFCVLHQN